MKKSVYFVISIILLYIGCSNEQAPESDSSNTPEPNSNTETPSSSNSTIKVLALGDSYTIGQSVCDTCRFPEQLKDSLIKNVETENPIELKIIARTGWTTTNLIHAIATETLDSDYNLVTLLIGVNNQYQNKLFSIYEEEFPQLLNTAIALANDKKNNVIVVSIPDYAYTPFGGGNTNISEEIDQYNSFAENYCNAQEVTFVNITDITRQGLDNTALVASDNLHPSELAYTKFVERILPFALQKLSD